MLTERQAAVAELVACGLSDKAIGTDLGISVETVRYHLEEIAARVPGSGRPRYKCVVWFFTLSDQETAESA